MANSDEPRAQVSVPGFSRRRFLQYTGLGAAAAVAAGWGRGPAAGSSAAGGALPQGWSGTIADVKHGVILMQENRSFDHYFGTMPGVAGFSDPNAITLSTGNSVFFQPDPANPDGYLLPWHNDTLTTSGQSTPSISHAVHSHPTMLNNGAMDNFVPSQVTATGTHGPYVMNYYTRDDIPFQFALAENFTICAHYFSSVSGPTWPNRLMH